MQSTALPIRRQLCVGFVLAPNFTLLAFSGIADMLRLSADEGDRSRQIACSWSILSHDMRPIRASCGVEISPTAELVAPDLFDYIVVVGGVMDGRELPPRMQEYLHQADAQSVPLVSVCTGCFILANLGMLDGRACCVSWYHAGDFQHRFPQLQVNSEALFVDDRDRITCAGGSSAIHMAAHLVEKHCGSAVAAKALRIMMEGERRAPFTPQPQPPHVSNVRDFRVRKAILLMERTMENPVSTAFAAKHVGVGSRQLERLFRSELGQTPSEFFIALRLQHARDMLEHPHEPIGSIALQCGFVNRSHFAALFRAKFGCTPSSIRRPADVCKQRL